MSKIITLKDHHFRLAHISVVTPVLPEYEDQHKQSNYKGYGFTVLTISGATYNVIYRPEHIKSGEDVLNTVTNIHKRLVAALVNGDADG